MKGDLKDLFIVTKKFLFQIDAFPLSLLFTKI